MATRHFSLRALTEGENAKFIRVNNLLERLDAILGNSVVQADLVEPQTETDAMGVEFFSATDGDAFIIAENAIGIWEGRDLQIAYLVQGEWEYLTPRVGYRVYDQATDRFLYWNGTIWVTEFSTAISSDGSGLARVTSDTSLQGDGTPQDPLGIPLGAITASYLGAASVTETKLQDNSVITTKIRDRNVTGSKIALNTIIGENFLDNSITSSKIADDAVTASKIADDAVGTDQIIDDSITTALIRDRAVTGEKLALGAVSTAHIADGSITRQLLTQDVIDLIGTGGGSNQGVTLSDGVIMENHIARGAVTSTKLAANAVTAVAIADNAVTASAIAVNSIGSTKILDNAITTFKIINSAITNPKLANDSVDARVLADNAVDSAALRNNAVTSDKIIDGAISEGKLADGAVSFDKIDSATIATEVQAETGTAANVLMTPQRTLQAIDEAIPDTQRVPATGRSAGLTLKIGSDGSSLEFSEDVGLTSVSSDSTLTGTGIPSSPLSLANNSVTSARIQNDAVTNAKINNGAVSFAKISNAAIASQSVAETGTSTNTLMTPQRTRQAIDNRVPQSGLITANERTKLDGIQAGANVGITSVAVSSTYFTGNGTQSSPLNIRNGSITATLLANDSVTSSKIDDNAIGSSHIVSGAVGESEIASGAVTSVKIRDESVTSAKLAGNSVSSATIVNGAITNAKIGNGAVSFAKISTSAIASQTEAETGTSTVKLMTPQRDRQALTNYTQPFTATEKTKLSGIADGANVGITSLTTGQRMTMNIGNLGGGEWRINVNTDNVREQIAASDNEATNGTGDNFVRGRQMIPAFQQYTTRFLQADKSKLDSIERDANVGITSITGGVGIIAGVSGTTRADVRADIATQTEAETGTSNTKLMTALRVRQAIDERVPQTNQGITSVSSDSTLSGLGTSTSPLSIADGGITAIKITDESITSAKLADNSVTSGRIANGAVTFSKISSGSIATQSQAQVGTSTNTLMTPLRVEQWGRFRGYINTINTGSGLTDSKSGTTETINIDFAETDDISSTTLNTTEVMNPSLTRQLVLNMRDDRVIGDITQITAGTGLLGGGNTGNVSLNVDFAEESDATGGANTTEVMNPLRTRQAIDARVPQNRIIPPGGSTGQVLKKRSNNNYDVSWQNDTDTQTITQYDETVSGSESSSLFNVQFAGNIISPYDITARLNLRRRFFGSSRTFSDSITLTYNGTQTRNIRPRVSPSTLAYIFTLNIDTFRSQLRIGITPTGSWELVYPLFYTVTVRVAGTRPRGSGGTSSSFTYNQDNVVQLQHSDVDRNISDNFRIRTFFDVNGAIHDATIDAEDLYDDVIDGAVSAKNLVIPTPSGDLGGINYNYDLETDEDDETYKLKSLSYRSTSNLGPVNIQKAFLKNNSTKIDIIPEATDDNQEDSTE